MIYPLGQRPPPFPQAGYRAHRSSPHPPCSLARPQGVQAGKNGWVRTRSPAVEIHFRLECRASFWRRCQVWGLRPSCAESPPLHKDPVGQAGQGSGDTTWHCCHSPCARPCVQCFVASRLLPLTRYPRRRDHCDLHLRGKQAQTGWLGFSVEKLQG